MIAVDTNILVYAHREDSAWHEPADRCLTELAESGRSWAIPWPCVHEFIAIVTHPRIFNPPTSLLDALEQAKTWIESPGLTLLGEAGGNFEILNRVLLGGKFSGPQVHDARVAAICLLHGIDELWTADRDFGRVKGLLARNPLVRD
jgi:toxin-antitoxin system PIN domain toxin